MMMRGDGGPLKGDLDKSGLCSSEQSMQERKGWPSKAMELGASDRALTMTTE